MQGATAQLPEIKLVGITVRTSNKAEKNASTAKIGVTAGKYFEEGLSLKIINSVKPVTTYCVYNEYESDLNGKYTYFIGEEVTSFDDLPEGFVALTLPAQKYIKFTSKPGIMPHVCIDMWKEIWAMTPEELGGRRSYLADFEIYDERASDPKKAVLDIYIGIYR